jgi:hypothetical protein
VDGMSAERSSADVYACCQSSLGTCWSTWHMDAIPGSTPATTGSRRIESKIT